MLYGNWIMFNCNFMKKILLVFIFILLHLNSYSQQMGEAVYSIKLAEDDFEFDATLLFKSSKSIFSYKKFNKNPWRVKTDELVQTVYSDTIGHLYYKNEDKFYVRQYCSQNDVYIYEDFIQLNWNITENEKIIEGLICKNATTTFRGRSYNIWFSPAIPTTCGPWKFQGLPGLIVSVTDSKSEVIIKLKSLELLKNNIKKLEFQFNENVIERKEFEKCLQKTWNDDIKRTISKLEGIKAKYPNLEIDIDVPNERPKTELDAN
jgi:GLPGLI family protein